MLREHGIVGAASSDVKASTLAAFALGDYEWILALEGDDLARIVDVMKDLRYVEARRYVDVDTPSSPASAFLRWCGPTVR